ncbi:iron-sulfur cluster repair di-iron protein [Metabacillus malikii]|uniref:Regulator of cell morphogenesis and NO signaling n=1 Tax=Metabacillus malikii TaxID=1504265 RepID=A0ABT9ZDL4_9BACI|nr:iron-sulfur cluster repair di-iron protein [Metabacillus malikii]MDQ0230029.1 regulator of cell morphogenesis and NO signaling [Metabacillus malikii]
MINHSIFNLNHTVGDVVAVFPQSSDFFKRKKVDFCCGGTRTLAQAIEERNLNEAEFIEQLHQYYEEHARSEDTTDWREVHADKLVKHIVDVHHHYARTEVEQLTPYVKKVALVHGDKHTHLNKVLSLFNDLKLEIAEHFSKEENEAFPKILKYEETKSIQTLKELKPIVSCLVDEHDAAGEILKQIREVTHDYELPEDACGTFRLVYQRLELLENDMFQHIHLENNILFPRYI